MENLRTEIQNQMDEVMDWFDFEKVHRCMVALNWTWYDVGVPDVPTMRKKVREYMVDAYRVNGAVGSGGFEVEYNEDTKSFKVRFVVADWDTEVE